MKHIILLTLILFNTALQPKALATTDVASQFEANHVAMRVSDLPSAVRWWKDVFGAQEIRRSAIANINPDIEIVFMHINQTFHIELVGGGKPEERFIPSDISNDYEVAGYKHIGFKVQNIDTIKAHLRAQGVQIDYEITRKDYGVHILLIKEPSGRYVELYAPIDTE